MPKTNKEIVEEKIKYEPLDEVTSLEKEIEDLYGDIERKVDPDTMSMINKMVDLNIEIEKHCNQ